jgi:hypothetical protein
MNQIVTYRPLAQTLNQLPNDQTISTTTAATVEKCHDLNPYIACTELQSVAGEEILQDIK